MPLRTARYVLVGAHNSLMTTTAIKLMKQKRLYLRSRRMTLSHRQCTVRGREKERERLRNREKVAAGKEAQAENVDLVSVKLG